MVYLLCKGVKGQMSGNHKGVKLDTFWKRLYGKD